VIVASNTHILIRAGAVLDAVNTCGVNDTLWLRPDHSIAAIGPYESIHNQIYKNLTPTQRASIKIIDRPDSLIIPFLINTHTHLDLTHLGPLPYNGDFISWVDRIRDGRYYDEIGIRNSTNLGIQLSRKGGTAAVGDIAGTFSTIPFQTLAASNLKGTSYIELFGQGIIQKNAIKRMNEIVQTYHNQSTKNVKLGLQPHAPYSAGLDLFLAAVQTAQKFNLPLATHLAETQAEIEFTKFATGPQADLIKRLGKWDDSITPTGLHSVDHLEQIMKESQSLKHGWTLAHLNYVNDNHIAKLASWNATVIYCPRASAYFHHENHRYRDMIKAGVRVALGTDSIIGLDTPDRISILDEMRFLYQRDRTNPQTLLKMATINGAKALNLNQNLVTFQPTPPENPTPIPGLIALPLNPNLKENPLTQALNNNTNFEIIHFPPTPQKSPPPIAGR